MVFHSFLEITMVSTPNLFLNSFFCSSLHRDFGYDSWRLHWGI